MPFHTIKLTEEQERILVSIGSAEYVHGLSTKEEVIKGVLEEEIGIFCAENRDFHLGLGPFGSVYHE